jgi:hypothetical protein
MSEIVCLGNVTSNLVPIQDGMCTAQNCCCLITWALVCHCQWLENLQRPAVLVEALADVPDLLQLLFQYLLLRVCLPLDLRGLAPYHPHCLLPVNSYCNSNISTKHFLQVHPLQQTCLNHNYCYIAGNHLRIMCLIKCFLKSFVKEVFYHLYNCTKNIQLINL